MAKLSQHGTILKNEPSWGLPLLMEKKGWRWISDILPAKRTSAVKREKSWEAKSRECVEFSSCVWKLLMSRVRRPRLFLSGEACLSFSAGPVCVLVRSGALSVDERFVGARGADKADCFLSSAPSASRPCPYPPPSPRAPPPPPGLRVHRVRIARGVCGRGLYINIVYTRSGIIRMLLLVIVAAFD